ncbi:neuronal acetylcholine receptor subunit alpha-3-like [Glandiceps talaboti]
MSISKLAAIVSTFLLCLVIGTDGVSDVSDEGSRARAQAKLYNDLFRNYHNLVAPVKPHPNATRAKAGATSPLVVTISFGLQQVLKADTEYGELTGRIWLSQQWQDHRLVWNDSNIHVLHVSSPNLLWRPDIALYNGQLQVEEPYRSALLFPDGSVYHIPVLKATTSCEKQEKYFPHDKLVCKFVIGSWGYDASYLDIQMREDGFWLDHYIEHPEWVVVKHVAERHERKYLCCPETYIDITYTIEFARNPSFYSATMSTPASLIVMAMIFIFALPPASREKMNLAIGILISLVIFDAMLLMVTSSATAMSRLMLFGIILDLFIIAETSLVYNIYCRTIRTHPIPDWIRTVFMDILSRPLCLTKPNQRRYEMELKYAQNGDDGKVMDEDLDRSIPKLEDAGEEWRFVARVIDRLFFWIFVIIIIVGVASILAPTS